MVKFIDNIICFSMTNISDSKKINQEALLVSSDKPDEKYALKLYKNSFFA